MASRKTILRAIHHLRASGCFNAHLEDPGAIDSLATDWFSSFIDLTEQQFVDACKAWLDGEDGRKWPTKYDLRECHKATTQSARRTFEGCAACDQTGFRELVRIGPREEDRVRMTAPCSCPKGQHFSNPPPRPANYPGPDWPKLDPWDVTVRKLEAKGFAVLVVDAEEPFFALTDIDTSERTRARVEEGRKHQAEVQAYVAGLVDKWRMFPEDGSARRRRP